MRVALGAWRAQGPEKDVRKQVSIPTLRARQEVAGPPRPRQHAGRVCMAYRARPFTCGMVVPAGLETEGGLVGIRNFLGLDPGAATSRSSAAVSAVRRFVGGPCTESQSHDIASADEAERSAGPFQSLPPAVKCLRESPSGATRSL